MSIAARRHQRVTRVSQAPPSGGGWMRTIAHGDELVVSDVGPWTVLGVNKGSESLQTLSVPSRGYWRLDNPEEFAPTSAWPSNANDANPSVLNNPSLKGGIVTGSPVTIDGYSVPVGTYICQFRELEEPSFYSSNTTGKFLFRACKLRSDVGMGGEGIVNDSTAGSTYSIALHYCDIGLNSINPPNSGLGLMHIKLLRGSGHRILRNYHTRSSTFIQPNTGNVDVIENYIDEMIYTYGESGPNGAFNDPLHLNGISTEGAMNGLRVRRNRVLAPSPDGANGSTGSAAGQIGYGTQPGQTGYGSGTNPGRLVTQTDCIAMFTAQGLNTNIAVTDNFLGGTGYCFYGSDSGAGASTNNVFTGNKVTTKWWTNGGSFGAYTGSIVFGSNGNVNSNNTWADDYGSGGNGCTALANRQYPTGNGPRKGQAFM